jgi:coenzyme PQQ precursor peptide PqqA
MGSRVVRGSGPRGRTGPDGGAIERPGRQTSQTSTGVFTMKWERPAATDMRFGFEITMYIANR